MNDSFTYHISKILKRKKKREKEKSFMPTKLIKNQHNYPNLIRSIYFQINN